MAALKRRAGRVVALPSVSMTAAEPTAKNVVDLKYSHLYGISLFTERATR